jgi:hypothetical protein
MSTLLKLLALLLATTANADVWVVVGKTSPIEKLNEQEAANIFLAKTNRLADGSRITTLKLMDPNNESSFYYKISGKNPSQITSYWTALIFTGKGKPPKEFTDRHKLLAELTQKPEAIAYISSEQMTDQMTDQMKVIYKFN